ncbi:MAG: T9SS type A sorting domain-containing protein, partial [Balneolaceae bacterium]
ISSVKPKSGSQHFRLEYDGETNDEGEPLVQFMSAPFFGYQPFGNYEVTINFEVGGTNFSNEVFDFYFFDGKTGAWSGGVIIANGTIFSADLNEEGEVEFFAENGNTANVTSGEYHTLRISFNATGEEINYYFNGLRIYTSVFLHGITPGQLQVLHRNSISNTYINVDDIEIKQLQTPYTWLSATDVSGVTLEGESSQVNLTFKTQGIGAGTYETLMKVRANDPANSLIEIPVTLEVNDAVSNEITNQPKEISLEQNYPNPFNPSTVISYQLEENSEISLQVFDMLGREVATLVNGERRAAGEHKVTFEAGNLSSGIYIYRLKTASQTLTRQMVLIK